MLVLATVVAQVASAKRRSGGRGVRLPFAALSMIDSTRSGGYGSASLEEKARILLQGYTW
jgi:hypothetical protein